MILIIFLAIALLQPVYSERSVELFLYWQSWARGEELFSPDRSSLLPRLRVALNGEGISIRSWEIDKYRNALLRWESVHSIRDAWHWLFPEKIEGDSTWIFWSLGHELKTFDLGRLPKKRAVLFLWEPPTVEPEGYDPEIQAYFQTIFTWDDDLVDNRKFFKFHYPELQPRIKRIVPFKEKKLCAMVARRQGSKHPKQLYSEREKVIRFFEDKPELFDLFGRGWEKKKFRNWKGAVANKIEMIKNYKFNIAYENMRDARGYITEKIFDCFAAATVPVYWGASNVAEYIPDDCFIDRRKFESEEALLRFMQNMSEAEYEGYLERTARFLESERAKVFSVEAFIQTVLSSL